MNLLENLAVADTGFTSTVVVDYYTGDLLDRVEFDQRKNNFCPHSTDMTIHRMDHENPAWMGRNFDSLHSLVLQIYSSYLSIDATAYYSYYDDDDDEFN